MLLNVTGMIQAVMITHDNCTWTAKVVIDWTNATGVSFGLAVLTSTLSQGVVCRESQERVVSYLPLSHIAAQMLDIHMPLALSSHEKLPGYATVTFARPDALKVTHSHTVNP